MLLYRQRDKGQHICMVALKNEKIRAIKERNLREITWEFT